MNISNNTHLCVFGDCGKFREMNNLPTNGASQPSASDYELLLQFVGELHAFRDKALMRTWLLDKALPALVPSDWLSYNEVDLLEPQKTLAILKPDSQSFFETLFPRFQQLAHQHPLVVRQLQSENFPVHKISDFLTQEAYHELDLYRDVYRPMGVEFQIAATIRLSPSLVTAFALARHERDYSEQDRAILELLRPHLVVAFNNLSLHATREIRLRDSEIALSELSSATLVVNSRGRILYHTGPCRQWVGVTDPGRLPEQLLHWMKRTVAAGNREPLSWKSDSGEIEIRAVPTSSPERHLLVLSKKEPRPIGSRSPAAEALSRRQFEVARWIREGKTNADIARILGISPRTVQKHVEHIFEKLGVETRVAVATKLVD
jgi:DNA-binding CsgD family transcriptional regulator